MINQIIIQTTNQMINQMINRTINQMIDQAFNQMINQVLTIHWTRNCLTDKHAGNAWESDSNSGKSAENHCDGDQPSLPSSIDRPLPIKEGDMDN